MKELNYTAQELADEFDKNWEHRAYSYRFFQYANILGIEKVIINEAYELLKKKNKFID